MFPIKGNYGLYLDCVILGKLIPARNTPENITNAPNEVRLFVPLYNLENGEFLGLNERLPYIMVKRDKDETFFSYGYDENKSKLLYSVSKQIMPNISQGEACKKHSPKLLNERSMENFSKMFFYLTKKVSSCITEKFNGFHIVSLEYGKKLRKTFRPVDVILKTIKTKRRQNELRFSKEIHLAYRSTYNEGDKIKHSSAFQCYYCNNVY